MPIESHSAHRALRPTRNPSAHKLKKKKKSLCPLLYSLSRNGTGATPAAATPTAPARLMRRPLAAAAVLRLRLLSSPFSSTSPARFLSPSAFLLPRRDDDDGGREGPSSLPPPLPPPTASAFSPRPLPSFPSGAAGLGLRSGLWRRVLPPAASRSHGAVDDAPPVRLTIARSKKERTLAGPSVSFPVCLFFVFSLVLTVCCFGADYSLRVAKGKKKAHFDDEHRLSLFLDFLSEHCVLIPPPSRC
jgi:hypothetical protein